MRLSETAPSRGARFTRSRLAVQQEQWVYLTVQPEQPSHQPPRFRKFILSLGLLVLVVAAAFGATSLGNLMITRADAQLNTDCTLIVPKHPLTAAGLATPYQLVATDPNQGPCNEANPDQAAFVEGAVLDSATGKIAIYDPLVIDKGTRPAADPVVPALPAHAVVALWFGFNGDNLTLQGATGRTLEEANCINGLGNSIFGQMAYCNAPEFFAIANSMIQAGKLTPPPLGQASDGLPCPTVRDFSVVDQDQSDNVTTAYLITPNGRTAQNTPANRAALPKAQPQDNGSDNGLLVGPLDRALGCAPWMAPDLASGGKQQLTALPLNELQAAMFQQDPIALVPAGDPMVLVNDKENLAKTNLYRIGVNQPPASKQQASTKAYCQRLLDIAPARMQLDMPFTVAAPSPDPATANNLFTFLAQRFVAAFNQELNCTGLLKKAVPITLQMDANGITIGATISGTGTGQGTMPTCIINGITLPGCTGTATVNGQTCTFQFDAATRQTTITCK
jgi:hypothetical protein